MYNWSRFWAETIRLGVVLGYIIFLLFLLIWGNI